MATLMKTPEVGSEPSEKRETTTVKRQDPRVLFANAGILTECALVIPSAIIVILYPLNALQFHLVPGEGRYTGETWWPLVLAGIALSLVCGVRGLVLADRRPVDAFRASHELSAKRRFWRPAVFLLLIAQLVLILAPWVAPESQSEHPAGRTQWLEWDQINMVPGIGLIVLGLACIAAAAWVVRASDPVDTWGWLTLFAAQALWFAVLGNLLVLVLFFLMGTSGRLL